MSVYTVVLFVHILGALALFMALALEGVTLRRLRRATTFEDIRLWLGASRAAMPLGMFGMLAILLAGGYLAGRMHAWNQGWTGVALGDLVLIGALGGAISGRRMRLVRREAASGSGGAPAELLNRTRDFALVLSFHLRGAPAIGAVFLMATKPDMVNSLIVLVVAAAAGILGAAIFRNRVQPARAAA